ncbi:MAG: TRAP transporter small permease subunit [Deltaproteobacteria bacterium]|nr:TRAP transporter small permease subunit [Deltaproteobacteria bacterium]MBT4663167.1 TRAP transporter small permease subunit [Candidatus Neomarinimicrobiota bacterium]
MALMLMVAVVFLQVICRYAFDNALAWPDEAARFLMLWMTGLVAPSSYRSGGFVAIDMFPRMMPEKQALILSIFILLISSFVLLTCVYFGWHHTVGFGGNFNSSSLKLPLDWIGLVVIKVKLRYMYASLFFGVVLLLLVNIELIFVSVINLVCSKQKNIFQQLQN